MRIAPAPSLSITHAPGAVDLAPAVRSYYSTLSGQPREKVARDVDRDNFFSAQEAMDYGLIDRVITRGS